MNKIKVRIDDRERGKDRTEKLEDKIDDSKVFEFESYAHLDVGDMVFSTDDNSIFVEVKTPLDFHKSALDGRSAQIIKLNEIDGHAFIYVLGEPSDVNKSILESNLMRPKTQTQNNIHAIVKFQIDKVTEYEAEAYAANVPVVYAGNAGWNKLLHLCKKLLLGSDLSKRKRVKGNQRQVDALYALGVKPKKARQMLNGRTLLEVLNMVANQNDPDFGRGIGKGTIDHLRENL